MNSGKRKWLNQKIPRSALKCNESFRKETTPNRILTRFCTGFSTPAIKAIEKGKILGVSSMKKKLLQRYVIDVFISNNVKQLNENLRWQVQSKEMAELNQAVVGTNFLQSGADINSLSRFRKRLGKLPEEGHFDVNDV